MSKRSSIAREMFEAHMAREMAAHQRAMAAAERRMSEAMRPQERAMEAAVRRLAAALRADELAGDPIELIRAIKGKRKPPGQGFRRRDMKGGEGVPVDPKPRPNPLAGAAAAPIE